MSIIILFKAGDVPYIQLDDVFSIEKSNGNLTVRTLDKSYMYKTHNFFLEDISFINVYNVG